MVRARSRVSGVVVSGPLEPFVDAYRLELVSLGYTRRSVVPHLRQVGRLSTWLQGQELTVAELDEDQVEAFLAVQRAAGRHRSQWSRPGLLCLLAVLRELRAAAVPAPVPTGSDSEVLLGLFERYLLEERGLRIGTVAGYLAHARRFLGGLSGLELHEWEQVRSRPRCSARSIAAFRSALHRTSWPGCERSCGTASWKVCSAPIWGAPRSR